MILALTAAAAAFAATPGAPQAAGLMPLTRLEATNAPADDSVNGNETYSLEPLRDLRLTVNVAVGGEGPFRFLVDTGADRSAVSHQMASRLKLAPGRDALLHSISGISRVSTASVRGLQIASRALPDVYAPLLDETHVGADGILGTDVLRSAMVHFDFRQRELSILPSNSVRRLPSDPDAIVVEARRRAGRLIVTEAELDGQRLTVVLDTGSEISVGNAALRRALERRGHLGVETPAMLGSVTGKQIPASVMTSRQLDIGGVTLLGLGIAFADVHTFRAIGIDKRPALLLGMNALHAFDSLTIDMRARKLRFVRTAPAGQPSRFAASDVTRDALKTR